MDAEKTKVAPAGAGAVDAAALAKAALATVMKHNNEEEKAVEKVDVPTPTVEQLQAELAALKSKMGSPAASKPSKEDKAAVKATAKAAAKEAAAQAKADAKAAKAAAKEAKVAAKAAKPDKAAAKAAAKAAREAKKAAKLAAKEAAAKTKADAKAAKAAAKAAKAEKKAAKSDKPVPSTGQGGPAIKDLTAEDLNDKETVIMLALGTEGHRTEKTIKALADECFPNKKKAQANSWIRNGLRRLVRAKLLEKDGRGVFKHSVDGRNIAKKLEEMKSAKK